LLNVGIGQRIEKIIKISSLAIDSTWSLYSTILPMDYIHPTVFMRWCFIDLYALSIGIWFDKEFVA